MNRRGTPYLNKQELTSRVRRLRAYMTDCEWVAKLFLTPKTTGERWVFQMPLAPYIVDFLCPRRRVVLEIDGDYHRIAATRERDRVRDYNLGLMGYRVVHCTNEEVLTTPETIVERVKATLALPMLTPSDAPRKPMPAYRAVYSAFKDTTRFEYRPAWAR